jgi:hypothetical protein
MLARLFTRTEGCGDEGRRIRIWSSRRYQKRQVGCKGVVICL